MDGPSNDWQQGSSLIGSVRRSKWLIVTTVLIGAVVAFAWSWTQPVRYAGVARVFVATGGETSDPSSVVARQANFVTSPEVLDRTVALTSNRVTRKELTKRLTVEPARDADVITVRVLDDTPERAANLADTVVRAYRTVVAEQTTAGARKQVVAINQRQARLITEIATLKQQQRDAPGDPVLTARINAKNQELARLADQAEEAGRAADRATSQLETLRDSATVPSEPAQQPRPLRNAVIGGLLGLLLGLGYAVMVQPARRRIQPAVD